MILIQNTWFNRFKSYCFFLAILDTNPDDDSQIDIRLSAINLKLLPIFNKKEIKIILDYIFLFLSFCLYFLTLKGKISIEIIFFL